MQTKGYYSRSEAFRDAVRGLISESDLETLQTENVSSNHNGKMDYSRKDVDLKMSDLLHEFDDVINRKRSIGEKYCLEIFITQVITAES